MKRAARRVESGNSKLETGNLKFYKKYAFASGFVSTQRKPINVSVNQERVFSVSSFFEASTQSSRSVSVDSAFKLFLEPTEKAETKGRSLLEKQLPMLLQCRVCVFQTLRLVVFTGILCILGR
jgi:hypothetical protein